MNENRCVCCNKIIPEGRQVCWNCENGKEPHTGCDFCNKIWRCVDDYKKQFEYEWDEENAIVIYRNEPWLYVPCEDYYYSGCVIQLKYCPKCGRNLMGD